MLQGAKIMASKKKEENGGKEKKSLANIANNKLLMKMLLHEAE